MGEKTKKVIAAIEQSITACDSLCEKLTNLPKARLNLLEKCGALGKIMTDVTEEFMPGGGMASRTPEKEKQIAADPRYKKAEKELDQVTKLLEKLMDTSAQLKKDLAAEAKTLQGNIDVLDSILKKKASKVAKDKEKYAACFDVIAKGNAMVVKCGRLAR